MTMVTLAMMVLLLVGILAVGDRVSERMSLLFVGESEEVVGTQSLPRTLEVAQGVGEEAAEEKVRVPEGKVASHSGEVLREALHQVAARLLPRGE